VSIPTVDIRVKRAVCALVVGACVLFSAETHAQTSAPQKAIDGLQASSPKVRIVAISAIAKSKDPRARKLIEPLLTDSDGAVRAAAVDGLGRLGDPAALGALEAIREDADTTVQKVLLRVLPVLEKKRILVDIGEVQDITNNQVPGLMDELQAKVKAELERELGGAVTVRKGGVTKGYGLILGLRYIKQVKDGPNTILEVKCELTLVELPGKILRLSSNATAGAGVAGALPKRMEPELARDAVNACAPSLAKDFVDYARQRVLR
jgi:HEAT repeats